MTSLFSLLSRLDEFEGKLALLYEGYADKFASDAELSALFSKLATEETSHQNIIRYEGRVALNDPHYFGEVDADISLVETSLAHVDAATASLGGATPEDAVGFALSVEKGALEGMYVTIPEGIDPSFGRIVKAMKSGCSDHVDAIQGIIKSKGLKVKGE